MIDALIDALIDEGLVAPEVRVRNRRLGLALGAVALGVVVTFMVVFTYRGLPKDPAEWKRLQRLESARRAGGEGIGEASAGTMVAPAAADQAGSDKDDR